MAEQHTPTTEALVRLADSLPAVIEAVCRERQLRPILMRLLQHASDAAKRRAVRIAIINRIGRLITSRLSLDEILQTAIEAICGNLHFADLGLMLVDPANPEMLVLRAKTGIYSAMLPKDYRQSIHQGIIGAAARARQRILLNDVTSDPRYIPARGMDDVCTELAVPVVVGDRLLGVLNVESTRRLSEEDAVDLEVVADQLGVAIDNARLFARTQHTLAETQLLYKTSRRMSTSMDVDEVIGTYLEQVAARGRYVCTVMLYAFDEAGQRTAAIIRGRWTPWEGRVHLAHEETLFRIVQEALNNVVKHARARRIEITLRAVDGLISLIVRDDGQGFTSEPIRLADGLRSPTSGRFGLRIMRERAEALRGRIDVISAPGKGTIINVRLPQEDEQP